MVPSAESVVLDTIRAFQAMQADQLAYRIAKDFLNSSVDAPTARRRAYALLRIAAEAAE